MINRFTGNHPAKGKLNQLVDSANRLESISGDGIIQVRRGPTGMTVGLCIPQLLPHIPKRLGDLFYVQVTKDGGVAGSTSTSCTFTYTVKDANGVTLDTAMTPDQDRMANTAYEQPSANSPGIAYYDTDRTLCLYHVAEEIPTATGAKGDITYHNGTQWISLGAASTNDSKTYFLKMINGVPSWVEGATFACP